MSHTHARTPPSHQTHTHTHDNCLLAHMLSPQKAAQVTSEENRFLNLRISGAASFSFSRRINSTSCPGGACLVSPAAAAEVRLWVRVKRASAANVPRVAFREQHRPEANSTGLKHEAAVQVCMKLSKLTHAWGEAGWRGRGAYMEFGGACSRWRLAAPPALH